MMREPRRTVAQRLAIEREYLTTAFTFLVSDFGYVDIGRIPVQTESIEVRGWENRHAGVRVEISGYGVSGSFHGLLRRFIEGTPAPYDDRENVLEFWEVALVRDPSIPMNHNLHGWRPTVDAAARLLRDNDGLITGAEWIARKAVDRAWNRDFHERFGWSPDDAEKRAPRTLDQMRDGFAFLLERGFELAHDSATLSPHEYADADALRYVRGAQSVHIMRLDFREPEWTVRLDDEPFGPYFVPSAGEIAARATALARALDTRRT